MTERIFDLEDNQHPSTIALAQSRNDVHWYRAFRCSYLLLKVTNRSKRWVFRQTKDGITLSHALGSADLFGENEARIMALELARNLEQGILPPTVAERKRRLRQQKLTVEKAFQAYHRDHLAIHAKTAGEVLKEYGRYWGGIKNARVMALDPPAVRSWLNSISNGGLQQATFYKQFNLFKACIQWCKDNALIPSAMEDPTRGIKKNSVNHEINYLKKEQFPLLMESLKDEGDDARDIILMLLWTAQRKSNVLQMQWSEIDWAQNCWFIPKAKAKTGRQYAVALSDAALEILHRRRGNESLWVFPTKDKTSTKPYIATIQHAWERVRTRAGLEHLRVHDLRHTNLTWLAQAGASAYHVQRAGNHSNINTSSRYVHLETEQLRKQQNDTQRQIFNEIQDQLTKPNGPRVIRVSDYQRKNTDGKIRRGYEYEIK